MTTKKLTPRKLLQVLHRGFDRSGHTECQILADMLGDHIANEGCEKKVLDRDSVTLFGSMLDEVIANASMMKMELVELRKDLKP